MRKLLLFAFLLNSIYASAVHIQIRFVENFQISIINPQPLSPSQGTGTTDSSINTIFLNHAIAYCYNSFSDSNPIIFASYTGNNPNGFISDLENNPNVSSAKICASEYTYADSLHIKLINITNGNPTGINSNGNVTTTNTVLNSVFENYQVESMNNLISNFFRISFEGNIVNLVNELNNLDSTIELTEYVGVALLLSTNQFNSSQPSIYPNPFADTFIIDTKENIINYDIFDISGKQIIKTNSKTELDNQTQNLESGIYLLKLETQNGKVTNQKIIKR